MKLPLAFYTRTDVVQIAKDLLGKWIFTDFEGVVTAGIITETEAYRGETDKACHAYGGRRTQRTEAMYQQGGIAYIYLCYGIHHLFNVVTHEAGTPHAVLLRGIHPIIGTPKIVERRKKEKLVPNLCGGPGTAAQGLGLNTSQTYTSLLDDQIWIEDRDTNVPERDILMGPRIGVDYAEEDAALPYRFFLPKGYFDAVKVPGS